MELFGNHFFFSNQNFRELAYIKYQKGIIWNFSLLARLTINNRCTNCANFFTIEFLWFISVFLINKTRLLIFFHSAVSILIWIILSMHKVSQISVLKTRVLISIHRWLFNDMFWQLCTFCYGSIEFS